ncbi:hypothetical protein BC827DRAFT_1240938 [Russula dissimulans]|nr:hypothetical protein BC827DRAFT_1240938 [Russula dissimulans]
MPLSPEITRAFAAIERGGGPITHENQYYGPYNKLLNTLFPPDSDFIVSPNYLPVDVDSAADFVITFEVTLHQYHVLIIEIKPPQHLQIHNRLVDLEGHTPLPILYGISAVGTRLCFYEFEKADLEFATDVAPQERWDCDVLEADGEQRL